MMKTTKKLAAGQPGTRKWLQKYGECLICVRYKYDPHKNKKMITVELKEELCDWKKNKQRIPDNKIVYLKIEFEEIELRKRIRSLGGSWNNLKKNWELPYKHVKSLNLEKRMVPNE
jgi:hypothetical protein